MKYAKMLALAAVAAGALMAFIGAGTASATVICSTKVESGSCPAAQKWANGTVIDFSVPAGGSLLLVDTSGKTLDTCKEGTVEGSITNSGSATETVTGELSQSEGTIAKTGLTWGNCTFPTKTLSATGKLEIHVKGTAGNAEVTSDSEYEVTINTVLLGSCVYGVNAGTSLGELTEGNPPIFHANATAIKKGGGGACPETSKWTGTYTMTSPASTTGWVTTS